MISEPLRLYVEYRLGGAPRYYFSVKEEHLKKLTDEVRKCVAFLAYWDGSQYVLLGTAFWIGLRIADTERFVTYVVTAKHLIEKAESKSADWAVHLRVNFLDVEAQWIKTDVKEWYSHPNESNVDVAIAAVHLEGNLDIKFVPSASFATQAIIRNRGMGVGDEVFLTGLFGRHTGTNKNIPIVRIGNIAAMPEEPIRTLKWAEEMEGYLIESRSIGGLSGSPVFVSFETAREVDDKPNYMVPIYLLGLVHGHWDIPVSTKDEAVIIDADCADSAEGSIWGSQ